MDQVFAKTQPFFEELAKLRFFFAPGVCGQSELVSVSKLSRVRQARAERAQPGASALRAAPG